MILILNLKSSGGLAMYMTKKWFEKARLPFAGDAYIQSSFAWWTFLSSPTQNPCNAITATKTPQK